MKGILLKSTILFFPFFVMAFVFVAFDPMKVLYNYPSPYEKGVQMNDRLFQARYLLKKPAPYNSFIFGSSKSYAFNTQHWIKYLDVDAVPFHMGVNDESIFGVDLKINFLVREGYAIKNALVTFDNRLLSLNKNADAHIFVEAPVVTGEPKFEFYQKFIKAYLNPHFLTQLIIWNNVNADSMVSYYMNTFQFGYSAATGDKTFAEYDSMLAKSEDQFYLHQQTMFHYRDTSGNSYYQKIINTQTLKLLQDMKSVFEQQQTDYKIILAPDFDMVKLDSEDFKILKDLFGSHLYDFSGENEITKNQRNYYEQRHFRPFVADTILKKIYSAPAF